MHTVISETSPTLAEVKAEVAKLAAANENRVPWCPTCGGRVRGGLRTGLDGYRLAPCGHVGFPDWRPEVPE